MNNDLISRSELKDVLGKRQWHIDDIDEVSKIIDNLPIGEWIPVSERLPEQGNKSYLVTVDYGNGVVCSCQRFFFNDDIGWNDDCVIAWQPLPEPYKKGGAE